MSSPPPPPVLYPARGTSGPVLYLNPYQNTYTADRAYGLRMQRGFARGVPQAVARRGQMAQPEHISRQERFLQRWGFEERVWRRLYNRYIREINEMASPAGQITKTIVQTVLTQTPETGLGVDWLENRLREKLEDMRQYRQLELGRAARQQNPGTTGYMHFFDQAFARDVTPIELWWYH